jgi:hypothetical protein
MADLQARLRQEHRHKYVSLLIRYSLFGGDTNAEAEGFKLLSRLDSTKSLGKRPISKTPYEHSTGGSDGLSASNPSYVTKRRKSNI